MNAVAGMILIVLGVAYPMAALVWLNGRMSRQPPLAPRRLGLILALNGIVPIAIIFWGLELLVPKLSANVTVRMVLWIASLASIILLVTLRWVNPPASDPGPTPNTDRKTDHGG
jgi:hypothetical protein